ncbi:MAG TPA: hypothetical protein VFO60_04920 [Candidatus Dormibacteraeota bacterium]|nr:hypothetical protein [Candidatus Dormibacteraeota bacterium]
MAGTGPASGGVARLVGLLRGSLPEGALVIGGALVAQGISLYAYLAIVSRALGPALYSPLSALWALVFVAAPGLFLPLEQETGRALAARRVRGVGGGPVVVRAGTVGAGLVGALIVVAVAGNGPITDRLFDGDGLLLVGLVVAIVCYSSYYLLRGSLAGNGRFGGYATLLGIESSVRVVVTLALAVAGVKTAWIFSLGIGLPCAVAAGVMVVRERGLAPPGPAAAWTEISSALTQLLAGSLLAQTLSNIGPLAVKVIATDDSGAAGRFLDNLIVARVPLFFFQAVQAALLPKLAAQAAAGLIDEFAAGLRRLLFLLGGVLVVAALGMAAVGPIVVRVLFGSGYQLDRADLVLLACGSEGMMICLSLAQGCIALGAYGRMVAGWACGIGAVAVLLAVLPGVVRRADVAFAGGVAVASTALGVALLSRLAALRRERAASQA